MIENVVSDVKAAILGLIRAPGFTATAVFTLALGIGASTAIFSVIHGVLLRPLDLEAPERLVWLWSSNHGQEAPFERSAEADLVDWRERQTQFESLVAGQNRALTWSGPEEPLKLSCVVTTVDFFETLGVQPAAGRLIEASDEDRRVVVLTHRFWRKQFAGDRGMVGRSLDLDGEAYEVVGVLPASFGLPRDTADIFVHRRLRPDIRRSVRVFFVLGRLAEGASVEAAQGEMSNLAAELAREHPRTNEGWGVTVVPLQDHLVSPVRSGLWTLFGAVGLVLLIACVNVANLLLVRHAEREREIAVRLALGAPRWRLARRLLLESLVLAMAGGMVGIVAARTALPILLGFYPNTLPRAAEIEIDGRVQIFALTAVLLTSLICGLAPILRGFRQDLISGIGAGETRGSSAGKGRLRGALVVIEVALALLLLAGAGLLLRSFGSLYRVDPGFQTDRLAVVRMFLRPGSVSVADRIDFFARVEEQLAAVPGVEMVGGANVIPLSRIRLERLVPYQVAGSELSEQASQAEIRMVTAGYFSTLGATLVGGRLLNEHDLPDSQAVAVVSETLARRAWPDEEAVGRTLKIEHRGRWVQVGVVGVVGDVRDRDLTSDFRPAIYVPHSQLMDAFGMQYLVRTSAAPAALLPALHRATVDFNPMQPAHSVITFDGILEEALAKERFASLLMGLFASLAALLAAVGIYAVLAFSVGQRRREIGIRMALGARPGQVFVLVIRHALGLTAVGISIGLAATTLGGRVLESQLHGVTSLDPITLVAVVAGLVGVTFVASFLPARGAMGVDPLTALNHE